MHGKAKTSGYDSVGGEMGFEPMCPKAWRGRVQVNHGPTKKWTGWARSAEKMSLIDQSREWPESDPQGGPWAVDHHPNRMSLGGGWSDREGRPRIGRGQLERTDSRRLEPNRFRPSRTKPNTVEPNWSSWNGNRSNLTRAAVDSGGKMGLLGFWRGMGGGSDAVYPPMMTPKAYRHRPDRRWEVGQGSGVKDRGWSEDEEGLGFDNQTWRKPERGSRRDPRHGGHDIGRYGG
ncbi:unnamed protein product [Linum trigynum]|uniref:Uncharacterized protein n=1 Tax=Linum trigynum TaxID=586398 RepID=A0AAV2CDC3_9ROSI